MRLPYEQEDIGLPEWGKVRLYDRSNINKCWNTTYRNVICPAYGGFILASHIMGIKDLWNHDAIFDYTDRHMAAETGRRQTSRFVEDMWDAYREDFGPMWTMSPVLSIASHGGTVSSAPDKATYSLGARVTLKAIPDPGYKFAGWSGGLVGKQNPVVVIMHANRSVTANFSLIGSAASKMK
jgi:uncharacterized repeat protein (TIGR02543 family)